MDQPIFDASAFARRIRVKMAEDNIRLRKAAPLVGISPAALSHCTRGGTPSVETYLRINRWLEA